MKVPAAFAKRVTRIKGVNARKKTCSAPRFVVALSAEAADCDDVYNDVESDDSDAEYIFLLDEFYCSAQYFVSEC